MIWNTGNYVLHKTKSEWGVGKVTSSNSQQVEVFFVNGGKRVFGHSAEFLEPAPSALVDHPLLNCISPAVLEGKVTFLPLPDCIYHFKKLFPDGFYDAKYLTTDSQKGERHYKVVASDLAKSLLDAPTWTALANASQFAEICNRLAKVESKTNLLHSFEKIKWHAALKNEAMQEAIAVAMFNDLYGTGDRPTRFAELSKVLRQLDTCAKWTIATYYGFLLHSETRIFIKPEVTKFAAEACGWDLQYESELNWNTLARAEGMADYLFRELTRIGLKPRDMIDIQSFIWCIDPRSYA